MAPIATNFQNGAVRQLPNEPAKVITRFSDVPPSIEIQVAGQEAEEAVEVSLQELYDDTTELCTLLESENAEKRVWMTVALAYAKQKKVDLAINILQHGLESLTRTSNSKEKLGPLSLLCWMYLGKCRAAPRVAPEEQTDPPTQTKDHWLQAATGIINEAGRINPAFPPLYLARGVLYLLRASLQPPAKPAAPGAIDTSERIDSLNQARQCFQDAMKVSSNRNMMAVMGIARAQYSLGKFAEALTGYQEVLTKMPQLTDPDPRIGIGCCFWQLGFKSEAREAWERSLELNPESKIALILIGLYHLNDCSNYSTRDPQFSIAYKKAIMDFTQKAFKLDKDNPLTCAIFGSHFSSKASWDNVEALSRKAIAKTDVNAIASDGWYLLARKEHFQEKPDLSKMSDYYGRADTARGGGERGYVPSRFGIAQALVIQGDVDGAKFRLDKIIQSTKSIEAQMLLGALYAEEVFTSQLQDTREDKSKETKRAIDLLEKVRGSWKDPTKKLNPDLSVLVYLARLYENDQPEKANQCLQQVEKINIDDLLEKEGKTREETEPEDLTKLREELSPQLLNNLACFQYNSEKFEAARDMFQTALNACVKFGESNDSIDTDALVTTISYNLARTYEAQNQLDEARQVYSGLLARHDDYTDARTRLAYIELRQNPTEEGPKAIADLNTTDSDNFEVRAMLGWYLSRSKKRASNIADDQEQKHHKKTLLNFDKHDRYALTGMGNLHSSYAREMRRSTDKEKEKRSHEYSKAISYFDKVLQLDSKNAYAAQGIGICLVEDKKDLKEAVQIFSKTKETIRESSVLINLGHALTDLKQYTRAIDSYEAALNKDRSQDPQVLACLGRAYLQKGKAQKSLPDLLRSLSYSERASSLAPSQIHLKFNIAFVQIQIAQLVYNLEDRNRTLAQVTSAAEGLDAAITSFTEIAASSNPPYPRNDIEQRANMGRNTMKRQLERAVQQQRDYEEREASRLASAKKVREAELKRREEVKLKAQEEEMEQRRKIQAERQEMIEKSKELAEERAAENRLREEAEMTTDSETGEKVKRKKKGRGGAGGGRKGKRKDDFVDSASDVDDGVSGGDDTAGGVSEGGKAQKSKSKKEKKRLRRKGKDGGDDGSGAEAEGEKRGKKRRKLARKPAGNDKFKSSERVVDSDEDDDEAPPASTAAAGDATGDESMGDAGLFGSDEEDEAPAAGRKRGGRKTLADDDEDEDEDEDEREGVSTDFAGQDVSMVDESVAAAGGD